jgi:hypothetical protein
MEICWGFLFREQFVGNRCGIQIMCWLDDNSVEGYRMYVCIISFRNSSFFSSNGHISWRIYVLSEDAE